MGMLDFWRKSPPARTSARRFEAATVSRLTAGWFSTSNSIDQDLRNDLDKLRQRSRDLAQNNDYVRKFLQMVTTNVIGPVGFTLQARVENAPGQPDRLANAAIENAYARWARKGSCEVSGRLSFVDVQRAVMRSVARDGEAMIRRVRGAAAGNPFGYALQLLDITRLDTQLNREATSGANAIIMGIEIDGQQRAVAFWLRKKSNGTGERERIPASEIFHLYVTDEPEQTRGYPWAHASMQALHDLGEFNKSALLAARKGADTLGFFVSPDGTAPNIDGTEDGEQITVTVPGQYDVLPEGYDFKPYESQYPNNVYDTFQKAILRRIASGLGVAFNSLANDLSEVNFSSIRSGVIEERDNWIAIQNWLIDAFMVPVFEEWLDMALLSGAITMPNGSSLPPSKRDKFMAHVWQGRRWAWVDPMKDIEASRLAVQSGIASPQMIAAQQGVDVDDVLASIAQFEALVKERGVQSVSYSSAPNQAAAPVPADSTSPDENKKFIEALRDIHSQAMAASDIQRRVDGEAVNAAMSNIGRELIAAQDAALDSLNEISARIDQRIDELNNRLEDQSRKSEIDDLRSMVANIQQAQESRSDARWQDTVEKLAELIAAFEKRETQVSFEATMPVAEPPVVNVTVEAVMPDRSEVSIVSLPTRETTSSVVRDDKGNIASTVQVERDA